MKEQALNKAVAVLSWMITLWVCKVFLSSLPYKFTNSTDTQHIFSTIGAWMSSVFGSWLGEPFTEFGAYLVGGVELITSLVLLFPAVIWLISKACSMRPASVGMACVNADGVRAKFHMIGGLMASAVMSGAVFFHLFTPLGIEVLHAGESDGGSLFYAAVSILILGAIMFVMNFMLYKRG